MARTSGAPRRGGDSGDYIKGGRYEEDHEVSGDRVSYRDNEVPEITDRADEYRGPAEKKNGHLVRENGDAGEAGDDRSRGGSP